MARFTRKKDEVRGRQGTDQEEEGTDRNMGTDYLACAILDSVVDNYFKKKGWF